MAGLPRHAHRHPDVPTSCLQFCQGWICYSCSLLNPLFGLRCRGCGAFRTNGC